MAQKKRKRRPGAGRKPLDPQGGVVVPVRFTGDDWKAIKRLAERNQTDSSKEIRAAVHYWLRLLGKPEQHIAVLICLIAILTRAIERRTGKKWIADPRTGVFVRKSVERLIFHFAPTPAKPVGVPLDIQQIATDLIAFAEHLHHDPTPWLPPALLGHDWAILALIVKDLGSGWQRNRKIWMRKAKP